MQGLAHLLLRGRGVAHQEVGAHGAAEEGVALGHIDEVAARKGRRRGRDLRVVELHAPVLRSYDAQDKAHEGCLARARLSDDGGAAAGGEVEREIMQDLPASARVGVRDICQSDARSPGEADGLACLFRGRLFQFYQAFGGGKGADELGHEAYDVAEGALYLAHELDEGQHGAVGDGMLLQSVGTPQEGDEIAHGESRVYKRSAARSEEGASADDVQEGVLLLVEVVQRAPLMFQGLYDQAVLQALLHEGLDAAVHVACLARELAHAAYVEAAEEDEYGGHDTEQESQTRRHGEEEPEGAREARQHGEQGGQGVGDGGGDVRHVAHQAVQRVAAVPRLYAVPFVPEHTLEDTPLHAVLGPCVQYAAHPAAGEAHGHLCHGDAQKQEGIGPERGVAVRSRGHVDGELRGIDEGEVEAHARNAQESVQRGLKAQAARHADDPGCFFPHGRHSLLR